MTTQNKQAAFAAFNDCADSRAKLIADLKAAGYKTVEEVRPVLIEWACVKTGAAFNVSAKGKVMLDSSHRKYEAAKTVVRDMTHWMQGTTRHAASKKPTTSNKVHVPKQLTSDIAARLVEAGVTKAQFAAMVAEIRAEIFAK